MIHKGNGPLASRLRQRKFQLLRRFSIPEDALPGSLVLTHLRCGKATCHCAEDHGHPVWSLTFMVQGKKRVQHMPKEWVEEVRRRVKAGREFQDAVREVLAANAQLLVLERKKLKKKKE
ncbi:MAG: DUF6788 family protein [Candidatus Acidiferrum sp.]